MGTHGQGVSTVKAIVGLHAFKISIMQGLWAAACERILSLACYRV